MKALTSSSFDRFWSTWPKHHRKVGREMCAKIWNRRGLDAFADRIIRAVEVDRDSPQWRKNGGEFIPMPVKWLNRSPWENLEEMESRSGAYQMDEAIRQLDEDDPVRIQACIDRQEEEFEKIKQVVASLWDWFKRHDHPFMLQFFVAGVADNLHSDWEKGKWDELKDKGLNLIGTKGLLSFVREIADSLRNRIDQREPTKLPYKEYLATPHWQQVRKKCLDRSGYKCQTCGKSDVVLNVHHNTYDRLGAELPTDLVALCEPCHRLFHGIRDEQ